jgi:hypothetical protein
MLDLIVPNWIYPIVLWELIWKTFALWYSARNRQSVWFVCCLFLNTVGILPIIYLTFFQRDRNKEKDLKEVKKSKIKRSKSKKA